jgi:hypothetical protein
MAATLATLGGPIVDGPRSAAIRGEIGVRRRGRVSCGGSCRLVDTGDGWLVVSLARRSDVEFLPRGWRTAVTVRLSWPTSRPPSWSSGLDCSGFRWRRRVNARTGLVSVGPTDRGATVQDVPWPVYAWSTSRRCGRLRSGRFRSCGLRLANERIESRDELAMPICLVDPYAFFCVCGQILCS